MHSAIELGSRRRINILFANKKIEAEKANESRETKQEIAIKQEQIL